MEDVPCSCDHVNAGNVPEMTGALKKLLDDAALRNRIGSHNRARAEQFSAAAMVARYDQLLRALSAPR